MPYAKRYKATEAPIKHVRYGREVSIEPQILIRRRRLARYTRLKALIRDIFFSCGLTSKDIGEWLLAPNTALKGRSPKECLNPRNINSVYKLVKKTFKPASKVAPIALR